jgi:crotonobetainyl-CoA:carnitine CoA-transferase CaiB-like acyl-CoA transferase
LTSLNPYDINIFNSQVFDHQTNPYQTNQLEHGGKLVGNDEKEGCFSGIRILDLAQGGAQICGKVFADLGADVIKIEPPGGDNSGRIAPFYKDIPDPQKSLFWFAYNTNKRSITLDIETADGREIFKRLGSTVDFIIESFAPGYLDNLGLGYEALNKINPKIIVTSITPFGQNGPKANYKGSDLIGWACSGGLYATGDPDRAPVWTSFPQPYLHAGIEACAGSLIAYWHRLSTNEGQHVDVSIQDTFVISTDEVHLLTYELEGHVFQRRGDRKGLGGGFGLQQLFPCKDGFIAFRIIVRNGTSNTTNLVKWMDEEGMAPDWLVKYDWLNDFDMSRVTQEEIYRVEQTFIDFFQTKTKDELLEQAIKRDIQLVPVATAEDICSSEQWKARNLWVDVEHDELDSTITYPGLFRSFSETPGIINRRAPLIGEHNVNVYEDELGYTKEELSVLRSAGVI